MEYVEAIMLQLSTKGCTNWASWMEQHCADRSRDCEHKCSSARKGTAAKCAFNVENMHYYASSTTALLH